MTFERVGGRQHGLQAFVFYARSQTMAQHVFDTSKTMHKSSIECARLLNDVHPHRLVDEPTQGDSGRESVVRYVLGYCTRGGYCSAGYCIETATCSIHPTSTEQRVSLVSNASSATTSGVVSDHNYRWHSSKLRVDRQPVDDDVAEPPAPRVTPPPYTLDSEPSPPTTTPLALHRTLPIVGRASATTSHYDAVARWPINGEWVENNLPAVETRANGAVLAHKKARAPPPPYHAVAQRRTTADGATNAQALLLLRQSPMVRSTHEHRFVRVLLYRAGLPL